MYKISFVLFVTEKQTKNVQNLNCLPTNIVLSDNLGFVMIIFL